MVIVLAERLILAIGHKAPLSFSIALTIPHRAEMMIQCCRFASEVEWYLLPSGNHLGFLVQTFSLLISRLMY